MRAELITTFGKPMAGGHLIQNMIGDLSCTTVLIIVLALMEDPPSHQGHVDMYHRP